MITYKQLIDNARKQINRLNLEERAIYEFLMDLLDCDKTYLILNMDKEVEENILDKFSEMLSSYIFDYKPIEYILGYTYFFGYKIKVDENTLIPRNETEVVLENALKVINKHNYKSVLDLASGSGAIAIAIKKEISDINVLGSDISDKALEVARINALDNGVNINFYNSDMLDYFILNNYKFDMIVSNPPYVSYDYVLPNKYIEHEPKLALYALDNGLYFYKKILSDCKKVLNDKGSIVFEIGYNQGEDIINEAKKILKDGYKIEVIKDYSDNDRVVVIEFV